MFQKMKIGSKLITITAAIIIITALIITVVSVVQASNALSHEAFNLLNAVHGEKHTQLHDYFVDMKKQTQVIAKSRDVGLAIDELVRYHNEMDIGEREAYDMSSSAAAVTKTYDQLYTEIDAQLAQYVNIFEYYDVFIICYPHGHVMYTHTKEDDLGTNLAHGQYRTSSLAQAWEMARSSKEAVIVEMAPYEPSGGVPAMFCAAPIIVEDEIKGIVALQVNSDELNALVGEAEGMGETGEVYCVGPDYLMRTNSRFSKESTVLQREVKTTASEKALNHIKDHEVIEDYRGVEVYSSFSHVGINEIFRADFDWAIMAEVDKAEILEPVNSLIFIVSILSLIVVIGAVIITIFFSHSISKPLQYGVAFASTVADGNLTQKMDDSFLKRGDEIGDLARAMDTMSQDLEHTIADIIVAAQNLVQAVQEISAGNENLSQRTSEQASSLEEIASTIEESTATIKQNAENGKTADKHSQETTKLAQDGGDVIGRTVQAINEVNSSSQRIEEIISVIDEIAFQTNLLALNAAVEAARAGEQGRGFAVVAGEVRNLAQRSGNAAKEISTLIKETITKVNTGTELSNKSGDIIKNIIESIHTVSKNISEIAAASDEQQQGISQINTAIVELDSMTQQNAGLVEETASASEEMSNQAQELLVMMEKFKIKNDVKEKSYSDNHKEIHLTTSQKGEQTASKAHQRGGHNRGKAHSAEIKPIEKTLEEEGYEEF